MSGTLSCATWLVTRRSVHDLIGCGKDGVKMKDRRYPYFTSTLQSLHSLHSLDFYPAGHTQLFPLSISIAVVAAVWNGNRVRLSKDCQMLLPNPYNPFEHRCDETTNEIVTNSNGGA
uniref:Secreted protein n=1 Tax=Heterorhabditis bacteriophora TaxID=37862 RepID=A0A1I7WNJ5_HETBA